MTNAMKNLNLTELETTVLTSFINHLYAEQGFSDVEASDLARWTKTDIKIVRGVLSSLIKKGLVYIFQQQGQTQNDSIQIVYLDEKHYNLHPEWSK
jgi:DNA-binding MarR family transcriptional regulator